MFEFPDNWLQLKIASGVYLPNPYFDYDLFVKNIAEGFKAKTGRYPRLGLSPNLRGKQDIVIIGYAEE